MVISIEKTYKSSLMPFDVQKGSSQDYFDSIFYFGRLNRIKFRTATEAMRMLSILSFES